MLGDMNKEINKIDENIAALGQVGVATNILIKLRNELSNIDRMCHRVSTMIQTSFIPAAYTISTVSVGSVIILSLLTKTDFQYGGPLITIMVSIVLVSLLLLMDDMDDPFDYRRKVYASVDLSQLIHLEEHWKNGEF
jgi:predicted membrane chloride channel (bestrophin family)